MTRTTLTLVAAAVLAAVSAAQGQKLIGPAMDAPAASRPDATASSRPDVIIDRGAETPKALLESMHKLTTGGKVTMGETLGFMEPNMRQMQKAQMDSMKQIMIRSREVGKVIADKIGEKEAEKFNQAGDMEAFEPQQVPSPLATAVAEGKLDWDKVKIVEKQGHATVDIGGKEAGLDLVKVDGKWYVGPPPEFNMIQMAGTVTMFRSMAAKTIKALDKVEQKIRSGEITKANFDKDVEAVMKEAMGPMGGPVAPSSTTVRD